MGERGRYLAALAVVVALGLATLALRGPGAPWPANQVGGVLYVLAGALAVLTLAPGLAPLPVCAAVLAATCAVEAAQLWHPTWLEAARATRLGDLLLGTTFAWSDFPAYGLGALVAWAVACRLAR